MGRRDRCRLDDGGATLVITEAAPPGVTPQALWIRVGPVFGDEGVTTGIWVNYQEGHMSTPLCGPVLIDPATWRQLTRAVRRRLKGKR